MSTADCAECITIRSVTFCQKVKFLEPLVLKSAVVSFPFPRRWSHFVRR